MQVLLIHGLSRTSLSLLNLDRRLQTAGHQTQHFGYFAWMASFNQIVQRLRKHLHSLSHQPYGIVAHSLGGLLTRAALAETEIQPPRQIVMLSPPNQPPRLAPHAWRLPPFRWLTGQCGFNLTCPEFYQALPKPLTPYTIVAGTGGPRGPLSPFGNEPNDGIVAVSETLVYPQDPVLQLPVWHTFMMDDHRVQAAVINALSIKETCPFSK